MKKFFSPFINKLVHHIQSQLKMARTLTNCLQVLLKFLNSVTGMAGIAVILYSLEMIKIWQSDTDSLSNYPWFVHAFVGLGIALCAITSIGHIAAQTLNSYCLSFYMVILFLLVLLETSMIAQVFVHTEYWEKELPDDPVGRLNNFKQFVKSHADTCQLIGLFTVFVQGISMFLAATLRTLENNECSESRLPLLNPLIYSA